MDINNLGMASFLYLMYSTNDGKPRASTNVFYGPWDSAELFYEMLNNYFPNIKPEGSIVAILKTSTNSRGKEIVDNVDLYVYYNGLLHEFGGNGNGEYILPLFLYKISAESDLYSKNPNIINYSVQLLLNDGWAFDLNNLNYDPSTSILWIIFGYVKRNSDGFTLCNFNGETATWSKPYRVGGSGGGSTITYESRFDVNITPDYLSLPVNLNNQITNGALKEASKVTIDCFKDGKSVMMATAFLLPIHVNIENYGLYFNYNSRSYNVLNTDGTTSTYYTNEGWLEYRQNGVVASDDTVITLDQSLLNGFKLVLAASTESIAYNALAVITYNINSSGYSYTIEPSPKLLTVTSNGVFSPLSAKITRFGWDGKKMVYENEPSISNASWELYYNESVNLNLPKTGTVVSWTDDDFRTNNDIKNAKSDEQIKIVFKIGNEIKAYDYVPLLFLAELIGLTNDLFKIDLLNNYVQLPTWLFGDISNNQTKQQLLRTFTEASLVITYNGLPLNTIKQTDSDNCCDYWITNIVNGNLDFSNYVIYNNDNNNHYKSYYLTRVDNISVLTITFKYIDPESGDEFEGKAIQTISVKEAVDYYKLNVSPSILWYTKDLNNNIIFDSPEIYVNLNHIADGVCEVIDAKTLINLNKGYSFWLNDTNITNDLTNDSTISTSGLSDSNITIALKDSNNIVSDTEDIDVHQNPEWGASGKSPYTLTSDNPFILFDDDSSANVIQKSTETELLLKYGNLPISEFYVTKETLIYESNNPTLDIFNNYFLWVNIDSKNNSNKFTLQNNISLKDKVLFGKIIYKASLTNGGEIIAELSQNVSVYNVSDGVGYSLQLKNNVLRRTVAGSLIDSISNYNLEVKVLKSKGELSEYVNFTSNGNEYIEIPLLNFNSKTADYTYTSDTNGLLTIPYSVLFDKNYQFYEYLSFDVYFVIGNNGTWLQDLLWDIGKIMFAVLGESAVISDNGYTISLDNDTIIVDDDTSANDLETVSTTNYSIWYQGLELNDISNFSIDVSFDDTINTYPFEIVKDEQNKSYHLVWKSNPPSDKVGSWSIIVTCSGTANIGGNTVPIETSKRQNIICKDFGAGEVYQLVVTPNTLRRTIDDWSEKKALQIALFKIQNGVRTEVLLLPNSANPTYKIDITTYDNTILKTNSGSLETGFSRVVADTGNKIQINNNIIESKSIQSESKPTQSGYIVNAYLKDKNGNYIIVDSENVLCVYDGKDGLKNYYFYKIDAYNLANTLKEGILNKTPNDLKLNNNGWSDSFPNTWNEDIQCVYEASCSDNGNGGFTSWIVIPFTTKNGKDGAHQEFIYTRTQGLALNLSAPKQRRGDTTTVLNDLTDSVYSSENLNGMFNNPDSSDVHYHFIDSNDIKWYDDPIGVDEDNSYEYFSYREIDKDGNVSDFLTPRVWSLWGNDGRDGTSVEYVYHLSDSITNVPNLNLNEGRVRNNNNGFDVNSEPSTTDEWLPKSSTNDYWTDDPEEFNINNGLVVLFVAIRKTDRNGIWQEFDTPKIWRIYTDGITQFTEFYAALPISDSGLIIGTGYNELSKTVLTDQNTNKKYINDLFYVNPDRLTIESFSWTENNALCSAENPYLWNLEAYLKNGVWTFGDPILIGSYGTNGIGIKEINNYYLLTTDYTIPYNTKYNDNYYNVSSNNIANASSSNIWSKNSYTPPSQERKFSWGFEEIVFDTNATQATSVHFIGSWLDEGYHGFLDNDLVILDDNILENLNKATILRDATLFTPTLYKGTNPENSYSIEIRLNNYFELASDLKQQGVYYLTFKEDASFQSGDNIPVIIDFKNTNQVLTSTTQTIRIIDVSEDGSSYKLVLDNAILYRDYDHKPSDNADNVITARLLKVNGSEQFNYETVNNLNSKFNISLYGIDKNDQPLALNTYTQSLDLNKLLVTFTLEKNAFSAKSISIQVHYTNSNNESILIDQENIAFVTSGEPGSGNIAVTFDNDSITIDDLSYNDTILAVSKTELTVWNGNTLLTPGANNDYTVQAEFENGIINSKDLIIINNTIGTNHPTLRIDHVTENSIPITNQFEITSSALTNNNLKMLFGTYRIKYTIVIKSGVLDDYPNGLTLYKYQNLIIDNISSDGSTINLSASPNVIPLTDNAIPSNYTITFLALKYPNNDIKFDNLTDLYTFINNTYTDLVNNRSSISVTGSKTYLIVKYNTTSTDYYRLLQGSDSSTITWKPDKKKGDKVSANASDTLINYVVELYYKGVLVDTETIDFAKDGEVGPQGPQGLRGLTIDPYYLDFYNNNSTATLGPGKQYTFYNDLSETSNTVNRRLSYLLVPNSDKTSYTAYRCKRSHQCTYSMTGYNEGVDIVGIIDGDSNVHLSSWNSYINNTTYWSRDNVNNFGDVYINNLLATNAYIDNLTTNKLTAKEAWIDNLVSTKILAVDITTENIHVLNNLTLGGKNIVTGGTITNGLNVIDLNSNEYAPNNDEGKINIFDLKKVGLNLLFKGGGVTQVGYLPLPYYDTSSFDCFVDLHIISDANNLDESDWNNIIKYMKYVDGFVGLTLVLRLNTDWLYLSGLDIQNGYKENLNTSIGNLTRDHVVNGDNICWALANLDSYSVESPLSTGIFTMVLKCESTIINQSLSQSFDNYYSFVGWNLVGSSVSPKRSFNDGTDLASTITSKYSTLLDEFTFNAINSNSYELNITEQNKNYAINIVT